jgi:hypothetical protein
MLEETASLSDDGAELERDGLKMRIDPLPALRFQHREQLIAQRIPSCFRYGVVAGTNIHFSVQHFPGRESEQNSTLCALG